jgi:hypothetical protein
MKTLILTLAFIGTVFATSQSAQADEHYWHHRYWHHRYWHHHHYYGYGYHHRGYWAYRNGVQVYVPL